MTLPRTMAMAMARTTATNSVGSTAERRQSRDSSRLSKAQDDRRPKIFLMVWGLRMTDEQCKCGRVSWSECLFTFETSQRSPRAVPWCNSKPMQPWIAGWQLPSGKDGIGMSSLDWVKTLFIFPLSTSRRSNSSVTCHLAESQHPVVPLRRSTSPYYRQLVPAEVFLYSPKLGNMWTRLQAHVDPPAAFWCLVFCLRNTRGSSLSRDEEACLRSASVHAGQPVGILTAELVNPLHSTSHWLHNTV